MQTSPFFYLVAAFLNAEKMHANLNDYPESCASPILKSTGGEEIPNPCLGKAESL
jgi:hypothetical protein